MKIVLLLTLICTLGCSVKKANAPGNPPQGVNKVFSAINFKGKFVSVGTQTLFMWPTKRDGKAMSRDEKVEARANIVALSDELNILKIQVAEKQVEITEKIKIKTSELIEDFVEVKCGQYQFCEDDDFLCEVDPEATTVDEWKEPESNEEAESIASCKKNLKERKRIKKEIKKEIEPIIAEATEVTVRLGNEIGGENQRALNKIRIVVSDDKTKVVLKGFEGLDHKLTTQSSELKSGNIVYDKENGFIAFQVPAQKKNPQGQLETFGDYIFKLEIGDVGETVALNGELQFFDNRSFELKTGRAALTLKLKEQ